MPEFLRGRRRKKDLHELLPMAHGIVLCCWHPLCHDRSRGTLENPESIVHKVQMYKRVCINNFTLREFYSSGSFSSVGHFSIQLLILNWKISNTWKFWMCLCMITECARIELYLLWLLLFCNIKYNSHMLYGFSSAGFIQTGTQEMTWGRTFVGIPTTIPADRGVTPRTPT